MLKTFKDDNGKGEKKRRMLDSWETLFVEKFDFVWLWLDFFLSFPALRRDGFFAGGNRLSSTCKYTHNSMVLDMLLSFCASLSPSLCNRTILCSGRGCFFLVWLHANAPLLFLFSFPCSNNSLALSLRLCRLNLVFAEVESRALRI